jgi:predicted HTH transcriptional regulator
MTQLVRTLNDIDRLCFSCQVPDGCDESHQLCLRRKAERKKRLVSPERTKQRQERKQQILEYMGQNGQYAKAKEITANFDWDSTETGQLMTDLKRAGKVIKVGYGFGCGWELK